MKIKRKQLGTDTAATDDGSITVANYLDRFRMFAAARGTWFVIRNPEGGSSGHWASSPDTPAQWNAWVRWYARKGFPSRGMRAHGVAAVPSEWPAEFDPNCPASDRAWRPARRTLVSPEERAGVIARFEKLVASIGSPTSRRGPSNFQAGADRLAALEEIEAKQAYWKSPLPNEMPAASPEPIEF